MSRDREDIDDALGAAHSLIQAMRMSAQATFLDGSEEYCAFLFLADYAQLELSKARDAIDDILEVSK